MTSFVDVIRPANKRWAFAYDFLCIIAGSVFLALMAQIAIPLWFTPVPMTMQTFAIAFIAAFLGSRRGSLAVVAYLGEGLVGLPVFATGGLGFARLLGPTGGYLIGFVIAAFLMGFLFEKGWKSSFLKIFLALLLGSATILFFGAMRLTYVVGLEKALQIGVFPFLIGDLIKIGATTPLIYMGWKRLNS